MCDVFPQRRPTALALSAHAFLEPPPAAQSEAEAAPAAPGTAVVGAAPADVFLEPPSAAQPEAEAAPAAPGAAVVGAAPADEFLEPPPAAQPEAEAAPAAPGLVQLVRRRLPLRAAIVCGAAPASVLPLEQAGGVKPNAPNSGFRNCYHALTEHMLGLAPP
jgi:translation initiation factor IF-2